MITAAAGVAPGEEGNTFIGSAGLEQLSIFADFSAPETYGFLGRLTFTQLGAVGLSVVTSTELTISRTKAHINRHPMGSAIITLVLDGVCRVVQGRHQVIADAGQLLVRLSDTPYAMTMQDNTTLVEVSIPLPIGSPKDLNDLLAFSVPDSEVSLRIDRQLLNLSTVQPTPGSAEALAAERTLLDLSARLVAEIGGAATKVHRQQVNRTGRV